MGIETNIFSLFSFANADYSCQHFLLVRAERRDFANWDVTDENKANEETDQVIHSLQRLFFEQIFSLRVREHSQRNARRSFRNASRRRGVLWGTYRT